jgi:hypothetical protein
VVKVIKTVVAGEGGRANRMDTKGNVYLLIHMGYRNCYYRYMELLGYTVTVCPNGTLTVVEEDPTANTNDEEQRDYVNLRMYWTKWKTLYPHMKVSRLAEDICGYCLHLLTGIVYYPVVSQGCSRSRSSSRQHLWVIAKMREN